MADNGTIDKLTPRQEKALLALLSASSVRQAAEQSQIPEKTVYNWLRTVEFQGAYRAARREAVQQAIARLQQAAGSAVGVLLRLATSDKTPAAVRRAACRDILDLAIGAVEIEDMAVQIDALKARLAALESKHA